MGRESMPTPTKIETSIHDMTIDEWKGLAFRTSLQLGRRPGTDGPDDQGAGALRDIFEMRQIIGRPPAITDGVLDEGTGLAKLLVENHRSAKTRSTRALTAAAASFLVALATAIAHVYGAPSPPAPLPMPIPVAAPSAR